MHNMMRAIQMEGYGGPEVLQLGEVPRPRPGPGEILVAIRSAGVNYKDIHQRTGQDPMRLPGVPGCEGAGVVATIGLGTEGFEVGDRVAFAAAPGGYAAYVVVPATALVPIPNDIDFEQATAAMIQGMTAHYLAHDVGRLARSMTVLVHAASGGTGSLLVQMAHRLGARVLGVTTSSDKAGVIRDDGADEVIVTSSTNFVVATRALTGGHGVNVVFDSVGRATFHQSLDCLKPRGMLVLYGHSSGRVDPFDPLLLKAGGSLYMTRPSLGDYIATQAELLARAASVFSVLRAGDLRLRIDCAFPLAAASEAHWYLESRRSRGKILLVP